MKQKGIRKLSMIAILSAMAVMLMYLEFAVGFAPDFYKLDFSEVPVLIGAFALGPVAGVTIEAIKIVLAFLLKGSYTAGVGEFANFLIGVSLVFPAALIYRLKKDRIHAVIGLLFGVFMMTTVGSLLNAYLLLPLFARLSEVDVAYFVAIGTTINPAITNLSTFVLFAVAPFNLMKGTLVSLMVFLVYKRVSPIIHGENDKEDSLS
ncbi:MAG: ECF transporter S component [Candidatus Izemoplasmatales bacterium]|nr:ECF transporter S component [Candidatus Izemoplasmatales bacterium]